MKRKDATGTIRAHEAELRQLGVAGCDLFGSLARDQARNGSDIDITVRLETNRRMTLFGLAEVNHRLEAMLAAKVELPRAGLRKIIAGRHTVFYMVDESEVQILRIMGPHQDHANALGLR